MMTSKTAHEPEEELLSAQDAWQDYLTLKEVTGRDAFFLKEHVRQILSDLLTLPESQIIEVADFVRFLKQQLQSRSIPLQQASLTQTEIADLCVRLVSE